MEEFYCEVGVNHYLAAVLYDCGLEDGVLVVLGGGVGDAEEFFDAFEAIDVAFLGVRLGGRSAGEFSHKVFELSDRESGEGHCFF